MRYLFKQCDAYLYDNSHPTNSYLRSRTIPVENSRSNFQFGDLTFEKFFTKFINNYITSNNL